MKIYEWKEGMTPEEAKDIGYWERNMLALQLAMFMNDVTRNIMGLAQTVPDYYPCGWYNDTDNNWDGWKRVISINNGGTTFHIPDDFDVGNLPQIEPNWDGHTTRQKWEQIMQQCGCKIEE
jgi:hypothetical protein